MYTVLIAIWWAIVAGLLGGVLYVVGITTYRVVKDIARDRKLLTKSCSHEKDGK